MNLTAEETRFLEILSEGGRKTYVHIVKGFGLPLTPMAPTFTNRIAKRLLKLGLIQRAGMLRDGYSITPQGLQTLRGK
jgi:DNA-binding Lrp family transcriptional regulator